jgi:integrase
MSKSKSRKKRPPKRVLALPDLEHAKTAVLNSLTSASGQRTLWEVVKAAAARAEIEKLAPHDLRRTCARLCHLAGGELDQIQLHLGHVSIQTTERYLGCKQKLRVAVNDTLGIEPEPAA